MIDNYSWITVYPEIVLLTLACVITMIDLGVKSANRHTTYVLTLLTLALVAVMQAEYALSGLNQYGFSKMVVRPPALLPGLGLAFISAPSRSQ